MGCNAPEKALRSETAQAAGWRDQSLSQNKSPVGDSLARSAPWPVTGREERQVHMLIGEGLCVSPPPPGRGSGGHPPLLATVSDA